MQRAERRRGERSPSPPGFARVEQGAHSCGVQPRAGPRSRRRARRRGRRQRRAERRRAAGENVAPPQAVSWLRRKRDINCFLVRWLDEIEEFRFDVEHVPGRLHPADPLTRRGFPDRDHCTARPAAAADPSPAPAAAAVASPGPSAATAPHPATAAAAVTAVRPAAVVGRSAGPAATGPTPTTAAATVAGGGTRRHPACCSGRSAGGACGDGPLTAPPPATAAAAVAAVRPPAAADSTSQLGPAGASLFCLPASSQRHGATRAGGRPPCSAALLCCGPAPTTPGCGGRGPAGPRLRPPLLVAGRGLAARAHPVPQPADRGRAQLTHVVGYQTPTAAFAGEVDTLLDSDPATYVPGAGPRG